MPVPKSLSVPSQLSETRRNLRVSIVSNVRIPGSSEIAVHDAIRESLQKTARRQINSLVDQAVTISFRVSRIAAASPNECRDRSDERGHSAQQARETQGIGGELKQGMCLSANDTLVGQGHQLLIHSFMPHQKVHSRPAPASCNLLRYGAFVGSSSEDMGGRLYPRNPHIFVREPTTFVTKTETHVPISADIQVRYEGTDHVDDDRALGCGDHWVLALPVPPRA